MKSTDLIHIDHVIHFRRISEKYNEKHFEVAFAFIVTEFQEKPRNFWQLFFSSAELIPSHKLRLKSYVKEGVGWYCAKDFERVSVDEEMALNHLFKALDSGVISISQMFLRMEKMLQVLTDTEAIASLQSYMIHKTSTKMKRAELSGF